MGRGTPGAGWGWAGLVAVLLWACASQQARKPVPRPAPPPTLLDAVVDGAGTGISRLDGELAVGADVEPFLGPAGAALVRCGALEAARVRFGAGPEDAEPVVLLLVRHEDAAHARCSHDSDRPPRSTAVRQGMADVDERVLRTPLGPRTVLGAVKGAHAVRVYVPRDGSLMAQARRLVVAQWQALPGGPGEPWTTLLPQQNRVPGSERVVPADPSWMPAAADVVVRAEYRCASDVPAVIHAWQAADEGAARDARVAFQVRASEEKLGVSGFAVGTAQAVGAVDHVTTRESILVQGGRNLVLITQVVRRSACAPVLSALATEVFPAPPPKVVPPPVEEAVDAGPLPPQQAAPADEKEDVNADDKPADEMNWDDVKL